MYKRPNTYEASDTPHLPELRRHLNAAVSDAAEYYERAEHNLDTRYCYWQNQTRDGRKHGSLASPPFPWPGASDTRIRAAEMIIGERVDLMQTALARMHITVTPTKAQDLDTAGRMQTLLRWYISNAMADEADSEVEKLANYQETFGSAVLGIGWWQQRSFERKTVTLDDLYALAQQAGPELVEEVALMVYDPARRPQARQFVRQASSMLTDREADTVLNDLATAGTATFPRPFIASARPSIQALQCFQDIFFPVNTTQLQRARWIAQRELLSEPELRERGGGLWEWDEDFVEHVIATQKGRLFNGNASALNMFERQRLIGGIWSTAESEAEDLYEVWYFYQRASLDGIPAIYRTVFHPGFDECDGVPCYGKHELMPYLHGEYPFIDFARERHAPSILSSRGIPELIDTYQSEIKVQRDSRTDRASVTTMPPIKVKLRAGGKKNTYGPGVELPVSKMDDIEPMSFGPPDQTSIEVERATRRDLCEFVGRMSEGVDPQLVTDRKQAFVARWLKRWTSAGKQMLQLAQQYTPAMTIPRVVGMIPKPVEISREAIGGQFDLVCSFDARFATQEFVFTLMERMEKYVLPMDTNACIDRTALIRYTMAALDPTLADMVVRDAQQAQTSEIEDEQLNLAKMFAGIEPPMKLQGQNFPARLQVLQGSLQSNQRLQQLAQQWPDFGEMLQRRFDFLQMQISQQQNRVIGMYGTNPSAGSAGAPQIGLPGPSPLNRPAGAGAGTGTPQPQGAPMMGGVS